MKFVIASTSVTDEIHFVDGSEKKVAGGAGIFALSGIKLWDDDVTIVTGVGADYEAQFGEWYRNNNLSMEGLIVKDEKTPYTVINYFEDGEREEIPRYGIDHYKKIEVTPQELAPYFETAKGIYIFKNSNEQFWKEILEIKKGKTAKVMWEIGCDATYKENKENVRKIAEHIDVLSINFTEAKNLLGVESLEEAISEFQSWKLPLVFLRRGSKGSVMITPDEYVLVPSEKNVDVVDPTGGGNSSSGAVLCGFCENKDLVTCARMGNLAAVMCLGQYGVPDKIDEAKREKAYKALEEKIC